MTSALFHGLTAFRGGRDAITVRVKASMVIGRELAAADRPIGLVGLVVHGQITEAYQGDCWSEIARDGRRYSPAHAPALVAPSFEAYCQTAYDWREYSRDYCEAFLRCEGITAVWIKSHAPRCWKLRAKLLARSLGVQCFTVGTDTRIWDFFGVEINRRDDGDQEDYENVG